MFLTADELRELTGYQTAAAQIRWLTANGIRHWIAKTGRPVVPKSAIDGRATDDQHGGFQLGKVA